MEDLVGTWCLHTCTEMGDDGRVSYPFGEKAIGTLMYDKLGHMSVMIADVRRPPFAAADPRSGSDDEVRAAFEGCVSYWGRYAVDVPRGVVRHEVTASLFPNWTGAVLERHFTVEGRTLRLWTEPFTVANRLVTSHLVWRREDT